MFRTVIFLWFLSVFAASADAKDLNIVSYVWMNENMTAKVTGGMISPEMPFPTEYAAIRAIACRSWPFGFSFALRHHSSSGKLDCRGL